MVGGGIAPLMFDTLQKVYGTTLALSTYLAVALLLTGGVLLIARERAGVELE
jgi:hypothetical protein